MQETKLWQACLRTVIQQTFYQAYWRTFTLLPAESDTLREQAFRLRYQVYCSGENPDGADTAAMERDAYDDRAIHHLLIHNQLGEAAGTVRVLTPKTSSPLDSFEAQLHCRHALLDREDRAQLLCEISRLCMAPRFRQRPGDGRVLPAYQEQETVSDLMPLGQAAMRRRITYAPIGLLMAAFQTVMDKGLLDCVSLINPEDFRSLKRLGIPYKTLGTRTVDPVTGTRQPVVFNIRSALDGMADVNPECWEIVSDKGRLNRRAAEIQLEKWHHSIFDETVKSGFIGRFL